MSRLADARAHLLGLPAYGSQDGAADPTVSARLFDAETGWVWLVIDGDTQSDDVLMFGFVQGWEAEFGDFSLAELMAVPSVELDSAFTPRPLSMCVAARGGGLYS